MDDELKRIADTVSAEHYTWGHGCDGWHFVKTEGLSVIRETMPSATAERLHFHERSQQFFYILSGEATFEIEGVIYSVKQNQGISINPAEQHKIKNNTAEDLEFLVVSCPPSHGDRINIEG